MAKYVCVLCGSKCDGVGNNPAPLKNDGECCEVCNLTKVVPARIDLYCKMLEQ